MKILFFLFAISLITVNCFAQFRYINPYTRTDGTRVRGHYRDVSNDGNPYNNANYLGLNNRW